MEHSVVYRQGGTSGKPAAEMEMTATHPMGWGFIVGRAHRGWVMEMFTAALFGDTGLLRLCSRHEFDFAFLGGRYRCADAEGLQAPQNRALFRWIWLAWQLSIKSRPGTHSVRTFSFGEQGVTRVTPNL